MNDLVPTIQDRSIPATWNYDESVKCTKVLISKWKNITVEFLAELWVAHVILTEEKFHGNQWSVANATKQTWEQYCEEIDIDRTTAWRWLKKYDPALKRITEGDADIQAYIEQDKYNVIYADPPWAYSNTSTRSNVDTLYAGCLDIEGVCDYEVEGKRVSELMADNAILFLWTTYPFLQESFRVVEAWGFSYKTVGFVWVKQNIKNEGLFFGIGNYTRSNSEICLIGTKGKLPRQDNSILNTQLAPRLSHSTKPHLFRSLIEKLYGELPRLELFARERFAGWDAVGNQIEPGLFEEES